MASSSSSMASSKSMALAALRLSCMDWTLGLLAWIFPASWAKSREVEAETAGRTVPMAGRGPVSPTRAAQTGAVSETARAQARAAETMRVFIGDPPRMLEFVQNRFLS